MTKLSLEEELQSFVVGDILTPPKSVLFSVKDLIPAYGAYSAAKRLGVFGEKTPEISGIGLNKGTKVLVPVYTYQMMLLLSPAIYYSP